MKLLNKYKDGNIKVEIFDDGTRIIDIPDGEEPNLEFPLSMDFKITNWCDQMCPMCHEKSNPEGQPGDIMNLKFIDGLQAGTEMALGGGKVTSHPQLKEFLQKLKKQGVLPSITVHQNEFVDKATFINELIEEDLIYGLGISFLTKYDMLWKAVSENENAVVHLIAGIHGKDVFDYLSQFNCKILVLGFKDFGRGSLLLQNDEKKKDIEDKINWLKENLSKYMTKFKVVSFDNLALKQLDVKRNLTEDQWNEFYQGNDGTMTMYVDGVKQEFARTSTSPTRYKLKDTIEEMFEVVKNETKSQN
ncbi:MAG: hypothetical protein IJH63_01655 [Methanobrevibacter sp.]|nr:hypothetical protein [Methanobrevibacter sp.]